MARVTVRTNITVGNLSTTRNTVIDQEGGITQEIPLVPSIAATLTTRTDAVSGELTLTGATAHQDGDVVDLFWLIGGLPGKRLGVTLDTVSGTAATFSGGIGDDLPVQGAAVTIGVPVEIEVSFDGDRVVGFGVVATNLQQVVLRSFDETDVKVGENTLTQSAPSLFWVMGDAEANPFAGKKIAKFRADSSSATTANLNMSIVYSSVGAVV